MLESLSAKQDQIFSSYRKEWDLLRQKKEKGEDVDPMNSQLFQFRTQIYIMWRLNTKTPKPSRDLHYMPFKVCGLKDYFNVLMSLILSKGTVT